MNLLFRILYATHARGTHHKLALDALLHLDGPDADAWRSVFLTHAARFMAGAKAPDDTFKDFKNHVLHPGDNFWGGAPQTARKWYGDLVAALARRDWSEAAWCAGVLSHYYTDPIHPFHTAQSVAENNVHRAVEWSINRAYDSLRAEGLAAGAPAPTITIPPGEDWLGAMVQAGAVLSNRHYDALIAHYDFAKGVKDPPAGLDSTARRIVAELLIYASTGFATVLGRAIAEAGVSPPSVGLTLPTVLATLQIPQAMLLKKLANDADRRTVRAMFEEFQITGVVEQTLAADDRIIRELHKIEVVEVANSPIVPAAQAVSLATTEPAADRPVAPRLRLGDDLVDAPSIGPKTAARFAEIGIRTVAEFMAANPAAMAKAIDAAHISAKAIAEWQAQAHLVLAIPGLTGTQSQLLTGAGLDSVDKLAMAPSDEVCVALLKFAASERGQRILRSGAPPDIEKITTWVRAAIVARAA